MIKQEDQNVRVISYYSNHVITFIACMFNLNASFSQVNVQQVGDVLLVTPI